MRRGIGILAPLLLIVGLALATSPMAQAIGCESYGDPAWSVACEVYYAAREAADEGRSTVNEKAADAQEDAAQHVDDLQNQPSPDAPEAPATPDRLDEAESALERAPEPAAPTPPSPGAPPETPQDPPREDPLPDAPATPPVDRAVDPAKVRSLVPVSTDPSLPFERATSTCGFSPETAAPSLDPTRHMPPAPKSPSKDSETCATRVESVSPRPAPRPELTAPEARISPDLFGPIAGALLAGSAAVLAGLAWVEFSRLRPDAIVGHPRRTEILEFVQNHPGATLARLMATLALSRPVARYHVLVLERFGHLTTRADATLQTSLFLKGQVPALHRPAFALLHTIPAERVRQTLLESPALDQAGLRRRLGHSQQWVSAVLRRMHAAGLIKAERVEGRVRYSVRDPSGPSA